jgi:hypothetical protein
VRIAVAADGTHDGMAKHSAASRCTGEGDCEVSIKKRFAARTDEFSTMKIAQKSKKGSGPFLPSICHLKLSPG